MPKKYHPLGIGMTPSKTELGVFLRMHRIPRKLSQVEVARRSGTDQRIYSSLEVGDRFHYLKPRQIRRLAVALGCDEGKLRALMPNLPDHFRRHHVEAKTKFGKFIRSRREELRLNQRQLAKKSGVSHGYVSRLETEEIPRIFYRNVPRLAKALKLNPSAFARFMSTRCKETASPLGHLVRARRITLGLRQEDLAKKIGTIKGYISNIELGKASLCKSGATFQLLAKALKIRVVKLKAVQSGRRLKHPKADPSTLGGFLAHQRLGLHCTQKELAKRANIPPSQLVKIERNRIRPDPDVLERLAETFECAIPPKLIPEKREGSLASV